MSEHEIEIPFAKPMLVENKTILIKPTHGFDGKARDCPEFENAKLITFVISRASNKSTSISYTPTSGKYQDIIIDDVYESITVYKKSFSVSNKGTDFKIDAIVINY